MRSLANKTNVDAPDSDYPFGRIRDNNGSGNGTPVNENVYGDIHQFFEKLMNDAGITPNELPDNDYSGFQLFEALDTYIRDRIFNSEIWSGVKGLAPILQDDEQGVIMTGCVITPNAGTPANFDITEGVVCLDGEFFYVPASTNNVFPMFIEPSADSVQLTQLKTANLVSSLSSGQYIIIADFHVNNRWNMPWTPVTLAGGWTGTLQYRIVRGIVELDGSIDGGAATSNIFSGVSAGSPSGLNCLPAMSGRLAILRDNGSGYPAHSVNSISPFLNNEERGVQSFAIDQDPAGFPYAYTYDFSNCRYFQRKYTFADL